MATDRPRFTVSLGPELMAGVEAYKMGHNYPTRSKAVEALIEKGIEELQQDWENILPNTQEQILNSENYPFENNDVLRLARDYERLDEIGKKAVRALVDIELERVEH